MNLFGFFDQHPALGVGALMLLFLAVLVCQVLITIVAGRVLHACSEIRDRLDRNADEKYIWRAGLKSDDAVLDLEKAAWYVAREIARLKVGVE